MALRVEDIDLAADRELVERWQEGDRTAFDDLYRRYFGRLHSYCNRRVGDHHAAEEIAQEAFVKALQALPRFEGERRFYPWVTVIASRLCVDHHRRLGRVKPSDEVDPGTVDGDHGARLSFLADVANLDRALQRLAPRHAEVLDLRERQGMTYTEIAAHLDVPHSTVEALLFRARKALRREFLAVSGEGRLASLPLIGVVVRRIGTMRDRVSELLPSLSQLTGPVAAGAVAVVLGTSPVAPSAQAAASAPVPSFQQVRVVSTTDPTPAAPAGAAAAPSPPSARVSPNVAQVPQGPGLRTTTPDDAARSAREMPVNVNAGPLSFGFDPDEAIELLPGQEDK